MIAEQTHKSSINPWGVKEALFSSSRQTSQTELHYKPDPPASGPSSSWSLQPFLPQPLHHSLWTFLFPTPCDFNILHFGFLPCTAERTLEAQVFVIRILSLPFYHHSSRLVDKKRKEKEKPLVIVPLNKVLILWVTMWRRHRSPCQRHSVCLIKPVCHSFMHIC